ncbi:hypothetical protein VPH35_092412 [Triticum aestivum]
MATSATPPPAHTATPGAPLVCSRHPSPKPPSGPLDLSPFASEERLCLSGRSTSSDRSTSPRRSYSHAVAFGVPGSSPPVAPEKDTAHAAAHAAASPAAINTAAPIHGPEQVSYSAQPWQLVTKKRGLVAPAHPPPPRAASYKEDLHGRCFRCLLTNHKIHTCREEVCCLHCVRPGHTARDCPFKHLPPNPLPPLRAQTRRPRRQPCTTSSTSTTAVAPPQQQPAASQKPPPQQRLVFPASNIHSRINHHPEPAMSSAAPSLPGDAVRRPMSSYCFLEFTQEMAHEELQLRATALIMAVASEDMYPEKVKAAIMKEYPAVPPGAVSVSLYHDVFLLRFSDAQWRNVVADGGVFHDGQGTPYLPKEWSRRSFSELPTMRYKVRLFLENLPVQAWNLETVKRILPMLKIHAVEVETYNKTDVSYYILYAWVLSPDLLSRFVQLGTDEPRRHAASEPIGHLQLPAGFMQTIEANAPLPECPRVHDGLVLVHLDYLEEYALGGGGSGTSADRDGRGVSLHAARPLPWARGSVAGARSAPAPPGRPSIFSRLGARTGVKGRGSVFLVDEDGAVINGRALDPTSDEARLPYGALALPVVGRVQPRAHDAGEGGLSQTVGASSPTSIGAMQSEALHFHVPVEPAL